MKKRNTTKTVSRSLRQKTLPSEELPPQISFMRPAYVPTKEISSLEDFIHQKLQKIFEKRSDFCRKSEKTIEEIVKRYNPIDIAHTLSRFHPKKCLKIYPKFSSFQEKFLFFQHLPFQHQKKTFDSLSKSEMKKLFLHISPQDITKILDNCTTLRKRTLVKLLDQKKLRRIKELEKYEEGTAGKLMQEEFFTFSLSSQVKDVWQDVKDHPDYELQHYLFLLNEQNQVEGYIPTKHLLAYDLHTPLQNLLSPIPHTLSPNTSYQDILMIVRRYHISILPVIDEQKHLLGIISQPQIIEIVDEISSEMLTSVGGIDEHIHLSSSVFSQFLSRSPWLFLTALVGIINSFLNSILIHYASHDFLAFVPLILGMSGTIGIQCTSIVIREMNIGALTKKNLRISVIKELFSGGFIGLFFGIFVTFFVTYSSYFDIYFLKEDPIHISLILGVSVFGTCCASTVLGIGAPLFFSKIRIDPAVAAGPIVSTLNDLFSLVIVIFIARLLIYGFF